MLSNFATLLLGLCGFTWWDTKTHIFAHTHTHMHKYTDQPHAPPLWQLEQ